jgi:hypothetical protein
LDRLPGDASHRMCGGSSRPLAQPGHARPLPWEANGYSVYKHKNTVKPFTIQHGTIRRPSSFSAIANNPSFTFETGISIYNNRSSAYYLVS